MEGTVGGKHVAAAGLGGVVANGAAERGTAAATAAAVAARSQPILARAARATRAANDSVGQESALGEGQGAEVVNGAARGRLSRGRIPAFVAGEHAGVGAGRPAGSTIGAEGEVVGKHAIDENACAQVVERPAIGALPVGQSEVDKRERDTG